MIKKEIARSFLKLAGTGNVAEAFTRYVAHEFKHHNQYFKGDRESLMKAMADAHASSPNKSIEVKQIFEDGETIITHSLAHRNDSAAPIAVVHILKFHDNRIVEMWDIGQELMKNSPNDNGAF